MEVRKVSGEFVESESPNARDFSASRGPESPGHPEIPECPATWSVALSSLNIPTVSPV